MKFEIPFDENICREQMLLNFKLSWKKNLTANNRKLYFTIPMFLMGGLLLNGKNYFGYALIGFGIHYLTNFIDYYVYYKKNKTDYYSLIESEIAGQKNANIDSIWEFNEGDFYYKDYKSELKMKWQMFKGYRIIDSNLFLDLNIGPNLSYVLAEKEIGQNQFKQVIEFVQSKIG